MSRLSLASTFAVLSFALAVAPAASAQHLNAGATIGAAVEQPNGAPVARAAGLSSRFSEAPRLNLAPVPNEVDRRVPRGFESSGFAQFMSSPAGRVLRIVAGAGMIAGGIAADSDAGTAVAIVGAVPLLAGSFDFCILSPLFGGPLSGKAIRAAKGN